MKIHSAELRISTEKTVEVANITGEVQAEVKKSGISTGVALVYAPHATGIIAITEDEEGLRKDILNFLEKLAPPRAGYFHNRIDENAHSHMLSLIAGCERAVPVRGGELSLGTWQAIFFIETDGPRKRKIIVQIIGE